MIEYRDATPDRLEVDTPEGRLVVQFPPGQVVYYGDDAVAYQPPLDPEPYITLGGVQVSRERADAVLQEILRSLKDRVSCLNPKHPRPFNPRSSLRKPNGEQNGRPWQPGVASRNSVRPVGISTAAGAGCAMALRW